jgi:hypothetical protein
MASTEISTSGQTDSAKTTDVGRDIVDPTQGNLNYLTSDQGVKISDTDNWWATALQGPLVFLIRTSQVENIRRNSCWATSAGRSTGT